MVYSYSTSGCRLYLPQMDSSISAHGQDPSRRWSEETIRGSYESSYQRSISSPAVLERHSSGPGPVSAVPTLNRTYTKMMDEWLVRRQTDQPAIVIGAVSNLSRGQLCPQAANNAHDAQNPISSTESSSPISPIQRRESDRHRMPGHAREDATPTELLGVGAFASAGDPR